MDQNEERKQHLIRCPSAEEVARRPYLKNIAWLANHIHDAVIVVDENGMVCYRNAEATRIYMDYGYIHDILDRDYREVACHSVRSTDASEYYEPEEISIRGNYYRIEQSYQTTDDKRSC